MMQLPMLGRGLIIVLPILFTLGVSSLWAANPEPQFSDPVGLLKSLEERRVVLDKRAKWLDLREADLKRLEKKLAERIKALEGLRATISEDLLREKSVDDKNIARLAKIFSGMKTKAAALGLKSMDRDTAILVLKVMSEKVAAKILSKMDSSEAVKLADELGLPLAQRRPRSR